MRTSHNTLTHSHSYEKQKHTHTHTHTLIDMYSHTLTYSKKEKKLFAMTTPKNKKTPNKDNNNDYEIGG